MMRRIDLRGPAPGDRTDYRRLVGRARFAVEDAVAVVGPICDAVRRDGYAAVVDQTERIDGVRLTDVAVPRNRLTGALRDLDPDVRAGLE
jgi:histidinol dehydrogenase